jgi:hypothetical protein
MSKSTYRTPRSPLTLEDGLTIWRARDAHRVQTFLISLVVLVVGLEALTLMTMGRWGVALLVIGMQLLTFWGLRWLLRRARGVARTWWHGMVLVLLASSLLTGCESMGRGLAKMHGYKGDPFPGPCAPESWQAGRCVAVTQEGAKP